MIIQFYGVRGSVPVSGIQHLKYGGNTSCVNISFESGKQVVFDSGTGIMPLGNKLAADKVNDINVILSHQHWDHIQGFPFFTPIYNPQNTVNIYYPANEADLLALTSQIDGFSFPLKSPSLEAKLNKTPVLLNGAFELSDSTAVKTKVLDHPGGGLAYILEEDGLLVAYVTDNELTPLEAENTNMLGWIDFLKGVDVLIHDAQYVRDDFPHKHGWGHSSIYDVVTLAAHAQVKNLILFHHDPLRTDDQLDAIAKTCESWLQNFESSVHCICARQDMVLKLSVDGLEQITP